MTSEAPPRTLTVGGRPYATIVGPLPAPVPEATRYRLSRFAYLRRDGDEFVLESPLTAARIVFHDSRAFSVLDAFSAPAALRDAAKIVDAELVAMLRDAGMLTPVDDNGNVGDETGSLRTWEFHDLLFHTRTRAGRHDYPSGGTYRFLGVVDPPPALADHPADLSIPLARPELEELESDATTLAWAQEARTSIRTYGEKPVTVEALGEFLYRVGRVADYWKRPAHVPGGGSADMDYAPRPYPSGGSLYELDLYVAANNCGGIEPGLYRYEPQHHRLDRLSDRTDDVDGLIVDGARAGAIADPTTVQVLIIVAARFARIAWKYESIAYSLLLKNVGVLYEAMYLVATSMGLAPCALGRGDSDLFARAAGTDYYAETSVGEFLLGSLPD